MPLSAATIGPLTIMRAHPSYFVPSFPWRLVRRRHGPASKRRQTAGAPFTRVGRQQIRVPPPGLPIISFRVRRSWAIDHFLWRMAEAQTPQAFDEAQRNWLTVTLMEEPALP